jgi:hypothetical protein
MKPTSSHRLSLQRFRPAVAAGNLSPGRLAAGILLFAGLASAQADDTLVKDYDISVSQDVCRQTSIDILHSLAGPEKPVMQLDPMVFYSDEQSEVIAVCRADKGVLIVFARGLLAEQGHLAFYEAFSQPD